LVIHGLKCTFRALADSDSDAATRVLAQALASPEVAIQEGALGAVLRRRHQGGHRELLARWDQLSPRWKDIIRDNRDRMTRALRDAVLSGDAAATARGCRAGVWLQSYDLLPTLLNALGEPPLEPNADVIAETILGMAEQLYAELAAPPEQRGTRDPQLMRQHIVAALDDSVQRFGKHRRREVMEAFLLLVNRDNVNLKQVLQDPHHAGFLVLVDVLTKSARGGVLRLLLSFLDDPHAPTSALAVLGHRCDLAFVRHLLRKIGREPSPTVRQNLKRITSIVWLRNVDSFLDQFDDGVQYGAVQLVMASGVPRTQAFGLLEYMLRRGRPGGRRAAAEALAEFHGAEANALALAALDDPEPGVQAAVVLQLRRRGLPGVLSRLVELLESPHHVVRQAARKSLAEFSFKRFLGAFDMLDDEVRLSTGSLVRKVDPQTLPLLQTELRSKVRTRRLRGLAVTRSLDLVTELEDIVVGLLHDEDHVVRAEAAGALAGGKTESSQQALEDALSDRSTAVQEAARKALHARHEFTQWRAAVADPRD